MFTSDMFAFFHKYPQYLHLLDVADKARYNTYVNSIKDIHCSDKVLSNFEAIYLICKLACPKYLDGSNGLITSDVAMKYLDQLTQSYEIPTHQYLSLQDIINDFYILKIISSSKDIVKLYSHFNYDFDTQLVLTILTRLYYKTSFLP